MTMTPATTATRRLVLASTSPYRLELLARLGLPFIAAPHRVAEQIDPAQPPRFEIARLAREKAASLRDVFPDALIIGSDSGMATQTELLGKPETAERAQAQLRRLAGGTHELITAVCVLDAQSGRHAEATEVHRLTFRPLTDAQIARYVEIDQPLDCAGSFRIERMGIALFSRIEGEDPNAIVGLPLIRLIDLLAGFGVSPLG